MCSYWLLRTVWTGPIVSRFSTLIAQRARCNVAGYRSISHITRSCESALKSSAFQLINLLRLQWNYSIKIHLSFKIFSISNEHCLKFLSLRKNHEFEEALWNSKRRGRGRAGRRKIGREEEEVSVAITSSIVPGTCAYPAPRAFGRRRVHQRKEWRRREEEKEAVEAKSDGSTLRTVKRDAEEGSEVAVRVFECVPHHVTLSSYLQPLLK